MAYDLIKISALPAVTPDELQEIVVGVGDYAKRINYGDVKADMVGTSPTYTTDTEPYLMRQTAHTGVVGKCALNKLVGGSLGWNQLIPQTTATASQNGVNYASTGNGTWTITGALESGQNQGWYNLNYIANVQKILNGHVYYVSGCDTEMRLQFLGSGTGVLSTVDAKRIIKISLATGDTSTWIRFQTLTHSTLNKTLTPQVLDLTAMFGSTIADYIYSLESSSSGSGIAWLSKYIDLGTYHAYDAGSIQSVQATAHVTTGFNQFDEVVEAGYWDATTGQKASGGNWIRCANYIPVLPNTEYKIHFTSGSGSQGSLIYLDGNKSVISYISSYISAVITTPSNCRYMVFYANNGWFGGNICINISKTSGTPKNGDYVPYNGHTYPLGSDTLRGYPMLVNNKLAFDGDIKTPDGTITRKYGYVDLGSLTWSYESGAQRFTSGDIASLIKLPTNSRWAEGLICGRLLADPAPISGAAVDNTIARYTNGYLFAKASAYSTAAAFKLAMSGVYLVYPLATETTESSTAFQKVQTIDADGTESFTTSSPVPVGHETQTPDNILAALNWLGE